MVVSCANESDAHKDCDLFCSLQVSHELFWRESLDVGASVCAGLYSVLLGVESPL